MQITAFIANWFQCWYGEAGLVEERGEVEADCTNRKAMTDGLALDVSWGAVRAHRNSLRDSWDPQRGPAQTCRNGKNITVRLVLLLNELYFLLV